MAKTSIVQTGERQCYLCGKRTCLEKHHIMAGVANRKISEAYGIWIYLCDSCHRGTEGAQYNKETNIKLKQEAQQAFEAIHGHEKWMALFRKNYL